MTDKPPISVPTESRPTPEFDAGMDWEQVRLNGGPPCFEQVSAGRLCGRAKRWAGHPADHEYVSLAQFAASSSLLPVGRQLEHLARPPISHDDALKAAQALIDHYFHNPGWNRVQCRIPRELTDTDVLLTDYILQQKQLAGRQPQMDDVMRYLESENFGDIATDHKDGGEFCISDAILSFVRFWEKQ